MNTTTTRTSTYAEERFALAQRRMGKFTASPSCRSDERLFEDALVPRDGGAHRRVFDHLLLLRRENILTFLLFLDVNMNGCGCVHETTADGGTEPKSAHQSKPELLVVGCQNFCCFVTKRTSQDVKMNTNS